MPGDATLMSFARAIANGDQACALGLLADAPDLALACLAEGATRHRAEEYFLLARWTTGRGGAGSAEAKAQQAEILRLLHTAGAA